MISMVTVFWTLVFLFALIGAFRGWTREVIVSSAVILALFTISQFSYTFFKFLGQDNATTAPTEQVWRQQFYIMSAVLLLFTFFGYQGPAVVGRVGERLRVRDSFQDKLLGVIIGGLNGYLIAGSVWSFLEYRVIGANNWARYPLELPYPFSPEVITRPAPAAAEIITNLPIPVLTANPYILPVLLVAVFFFVLVVIL